MEHIHPPSDRISGHQPSATCFKHCWHFILTHLPHFWLIISFHLNTIFHPDRVQCNHLVGCQHLVTSQLPKRCSFLAAHFPLCEKVTGEQPWLQQTRWAAGAQGDASGCVCGKPYTGVPGPTIEIEIFYICTTLFLILVHYPHHLLWHLIIWERLNLSHIHLRFVGDRVLGFNSQLCHLLAVWPGQVPKSLYIGFLIWNL